MNSNFPDVVLRSGVGGGGARRCRAVYSYAPQNEDELKLQEKDVIEFLAEVEEGWWKGRLDGKVGVFPSNFVIDLPLQPEDISLKATDPPDPLSAPEEVPVLPPKPVREQCRAIFSYDAQNEDELTLLKDDVVTIITKDVDDKGWWKGEVRGKIGLFPDNFVQIIRSNDETPALPKSPDRPVKNVPVEVKPESKIPLVSSSTKKTESEPGNNLSNDVALVSSTKKSVLENGSTAHSEVASIRKSFDLGLIKPDTVASHRKTLEEKVANDVKKFKIRPPVSGKPRPVSGPKPNSAKRLSAEILSDIVDGALQSKMNSMFKSTDSLETSDDLDLDSVGRNDMLNHITASRPKARGRRPSKHASNSKENEEETAPLTNGSTDNIKLEISPREKPKQHLPFMDELKVNLKSTKPDIPTDKKTFGHWGGKVNSQSSIETSSASSSTIETSHHKSSVTNTEIRNSSAISSSSATSVRTFEKNETVAAKVADQSVFQVFEEKPKISSTVNDFTNHDTSTKNELNDLKLKVERLEHIMQDLVVQLKEETDKRRQIEKELLKISELVTQV